jgi:hypothetical protein
MRVTVWSVLVAAVVAGGCNQPEGSTAKRLVEPNGAAPAASRAAAPGAQTTSRDASAPATAAPSEAPAPATREVTIPTGTQLAVVLDTPVSSEGSRIEEAVTAHLARTVHVQGEAVVAEGSRVTGVVTDATRSGKVKGRAHVAVRFDSLTPHGDDQHYAIHAAPVARTAASTRKKDAVEIGAPAAGGAIIGALVGGKKGALVGTAIGGGAGTAAVLSTRGEEVHLPKGTSLTLRLTSPLTVHVRE